MYTLAQTVLTTRWNKIHQVIGPQYKHAFASSYFSEETHFNNIPLPESFVKQRTLKFLKFTSGILSLAIICSLDLLLSFPQLTLNRMPSSFLPNILTCTALSWPSGHFFPCGAKAIPPSKMQLVHGYMTLKMAWANGNEYRVGILQYTNLIGTAVDSIAPADGMLRTQGSFSYQETLRGDIAQSVTWKIAYQDSEVKVGS
jgi:hypothetical protein